MHPYPTFIFDSYGWNSVKGTIELRYSLADASDGFSTNNVQFIETITVPVDALPSLTPEREESLDRALFALHLAGGASYYKTCLPKTIDVRSGTLSAGQAKFWNDVYENGLGEFFYKNDIDFRDLIHFPAHAESESTEPPAIEQRATRNAQRVLVPIGGGKDSIVTAELLKKTGAKLTLLRVGSHPLIDALAAKMELPLLSVKRALPKKLFELNELGALNGHVPITAYLSCLSVVLAILFDFDAVAFSNERSANEGNVEFHGKEINHQWSKSIAFEREFQTYLASFVTRDIQYFSALRPLSELHIAKLFSQYPQYFSAATSCNENWKILAKKKEANLWCGKCPKCAFSFLLFSAFIPKETLLTMFGGNLFDNEELLPLYRELLGLEGNKPFECVGTPDEVKAAFLMAHDKKEFEDTVAMKMFVKDVLPSIKNPKKMIETCMTVSTEHAIPAAYQAIL